LKRLGELRRGDSSDSAELFDDLERHYKHRLASVSGGPEQDLIGPEDYFRYLNLSRTLLDVERRTALHLRSEGKIADEAWREIEHELDLNETRLIRAMDRRAEETPAS
jgi:hypothetical protein